MTDFAQNYVVATEYNSAKEFLKAVGTNVSRGGMTGALVKAENGLLTVTRADGTGFEVPLNKVTLRKPRKMVPAGIGIDADGHYCLFEFHLVYRSELRHHGSFGQKLLSYSAFGNIKALKVGRKLRDQFIDALHSQGVADVQDVPDNA